MDTPASGTSSCSEGIIEAFCRAGDRMTLALGKVDSSAGTVSSDTLHNPHITLPLPPLVEAASPALVTFRRKDESAHCSRPNFYATNDGVFEVAISKVTREDEGAYEVTLEAANGLSSTFSYVLVVMGEFCTTKRRSRGCGIFIFTVAIGYNDKLQRYTFFQTSPTLTSRNFWILPTGTARHRTSRPGI